MLPELPKVREQVVTIFQVSRPQILQASAVQLGDAASQNDFYFPRYKIHLVIFGVLFVLF